MANGLSKDYGVIHAKKAGAGPAAEAPPDRSFGERVTEPQGGLLSMLFQGMRWPVEYAARQVAGTEKTGPEAIQSIAGGLRKSHPGFLGELGAGATELAGEVGVSPLLLPFAKTRLARAAIKRGELAGGALEALPIEEQVAKGYRSLTGFRRIVPLPAAVQRGIGQLEAPIVGAVAKPLRALGASKPVVGLRDFLYRTVGSKPGSAPLRKLYDLEVDMVSGERARKRKQVIHRVTANEALGKAMDKYGLGEEEALGIVSTLAERGKVPGHPSEQLAAKYPDMAKIADFYRQAHDAERLEAQGIFGASVLGEAEMAGLAESPGPIKRTVTREAPSWRLRKKQDLPDPSGGHYVEYEILDPEGNASGEFNVIHDPRISDSAYVAFIGSGNLEQLQNRVGKSGLTSILADLKADLPHVNKLEGYRTTGANKNRPVVVDVSKIKTARKTVTEEVLQDPDGQMILPGIELATDATRTAKLRAIHYGHIPRLATDEGARFLGIMAPQGSSAWLRQWDLRMRDPQAGMRAWRDLELPEINRMAQEGTLPGYENKIAKGPIFEANPLNAYTAQGLYQGALTERGKFVAKAGKTLGKSLQSFGGVEDSLKDLATKADAAGYRALNLGEASPLDTILKKGQPREHIFLPKPVADRLEGMLAFIDPDGVMGKVRWMTRAWDAYQGTWARLALTPYLFPATTIRNIFSEHFLSLTAGTSPTMYGLAAKLMTGLDAPYQTAKAWAMENPGLEDAARASSAATDSFFNSKLSEEILGPYAQAAKKRFGERQPVGFGQMDEAGNLMLWDQNPETGEHFLRPHAAQELMEQAAAGGSLDLGRLSEIRYGFGEQAARIGESSPRKLLHQILGDPDRPMGLGRMIDKKVDRFTASIGEELPRFAQWLEGRINRGLTAKEASAWVNHHHVNMARPLTWVERKILRRAAPFYRWLRFNIPLSLELALTRPWIPLAVWKGMDWLSSGDAKKHLRPEDVPKYFRDLGLQFPMRVQKTKNGPIYTFVTPQGTVPIFDLTQWTDPDELTNAVTYTLSPVISAVVRAGSAAYGKPISAKSGQSLEGNTIFLGQQMPSWAEEELRSMPGGRALALIDRLVTKRRDLPNDIQGLTSTFARNLFNPFTEREVSASSEREHLVRMLKAVKMDMERQRSSEKNRLYRKGASFEQIRERYKEATIEMNETLKELRGR
jgi:hypothetical protein